MFWITSDPVSYSQAIISSQLSQHLFCVSCLLGDSHLRYPLEQPEGSSLPGCSASPVPSSQKWTLSLLSTSTSESAEVARSARPQSCCQATGLSSFTLNEIPRLAEILQNMQAWFPARISGFWFLEHGVLKRQSKVYMKMTTIFVLSCLYRSATKGKYCSSAKESRRATLCYIASLLQCTSTKVLRQGNQVKILFKIWHPVKSS